MKHSGQNLLGVAPTPGEAIQQRHLHLEVGEHLNNVDVQQERFNRHPAEGSQVEILQEQGNCDTGGLKKGGEMSVRDVLLLVSAHLHFPVRVGSEVYIYILHLH